MKSLLAAGVVVAGISLGGCVAPSSDDDLSADVVEVLPAGSFVAEWSAPLRLDGAQPVHLELLGDHVLLTDSVNRAYSLTAGGGTLTFARPIVDEGETLQPPVLIERTGSATTAPADDLIAFPSAANIYLITTGGQSLSAATLNFAVTGPAAEANGMLYAGVAASGVAGQVGAIDPLRPYSNIDWRRVVFGQVLASPVVFDGVVFVPTSVVQGSDRGRVYAISVDKQTAVWNTALNESYFETFAGNTVDLVADDFGLYVASDDTQLYVLDRNSGSLRWRFYAGSPLEHPPAVTDDMVYQPVNGLGLAALDKASGQIVREPVWSASAAKLFISEDDKHVYALGNDGRLLGLDKNTGAVKFASDRNDFVDAVVNTDDATIYAVTRDGEVVRARANLRPGGTGQKL
ncbi:MAG: PQQ-binding-like beta-propeller repeat protein [Planctomycetota bacterium]